MSLYQLLDVSSVVLTRQPAPAAVQAEACVDCVCISEYNQLHVCSGCRFTAFSFEHAVDVISIWSSHGTCLVAVGDRSGSLHLVSPSLQRTIHSQVMERQTMPCNQPVFSALQLAGPTQGSGLPCLVVLTRSGRLSIIRNLPLHDLITCREQAVQEEEVVVTQVDVSAVHSEAASLCTTPAADIIITVGGGPWPVAVWGQESELDQLTLSAHTSMLLLQDSTVIQAAVTSDGLYLVTLTQQCTLYVWLLSVMVVVGVWGGKERMVKEFSLCSHRGRQGSQLCAISSSQAQRNLVHVFSVPALEELFRTAVSSPAHMARSMVGEEVVYLVELEERDGACCVCVKSLEHASPEERVAVLMAQQQFDEAEQLARKHQLEPEVVLQKKAAVLNTLLCVAEADQEELLHSLVSCVQQIKDLRLPAEFILCSDYPSFATTHTLLQVLNNMGGFLALLQENICSLELRDKEHWPANALSINTQLLAVLATASGCPTDTAPLEQLQKKLSDLSFLHSALDCPIPLSVYEQSSSENILFQVLDRTVAPDALSTLISEKLGPFTASWDLCIDSVLLKYLQLFLARAPTHSPDFLGSPWEAKALALIESMSSPEQCVAGCEELLHSVCLPWSRAVERLARHCLELDAPNRAELQSLHSLLQLKTMLQETYGILDFNYSDRNTGYLYIRKMLLQQKAGVISDALKVADMYNIPHTKVYMHHLMSLCFQDQVDEATCLLSGLPGALQMQVVQSALSFSLHRLELQFSEEMSDTLSYVAAARMAVLCAQLLVDEAHGEDPCCGEYTYQQLKSLLSLMVEFSVFLTPKQFKSPQKRQELFLQITTDLSCAGSELHIPGRTLRLCRLIGYSQEDVYFHVAQMWTREGRAKDALKLAEHLSGRCLCSVVITALQTEGAAVHAVICQQLAATLCSLCPLNELAEALSVFQVCCIVSAVMHHCESEVGGALEESLPVWPWAARFMDHGLLLDRAVALPACLQHAVSVLHRAACPTQERNSSLLSLLQASGLHRLALLTTLQNHLFLSAGPPTGQLALPIEPLLDMVLAMRRADHSYGLALLIATPPAQAIRKLQSVQGTALSSYSRVICLCALAADYSHLQGNPAMQEAAKALAVSARWGKLLRKFQISFSNAFRGGPDEKKQILSQLLRSKEFPPSLIVCYCQSYGLDTSGALLTCVRIHLAEWKSGYEASCEATMDLLGHSPFLLSLLSTFLTNKVCPYDYERIQFVLGHVLRLSEEREQPKEDYENMQLLLSSLVAYTRCSAPSPHERDWHSVHCHSVCRKGKDGEVLCLPQTSCHRLPLHLLLSEHRQQLLVSEMQHPTAVARLAPIAKQLNVSEDEFHYAAVRSLASQPGGHASFSELSPLLDSISEPHTHLSLTSWLAEKLTKDSDCVQCWQAALCLAQQLQEPEGHLQSQLRVARIRELLTEAGLSSYRHLAEEEGTSIITTLYSELPLQGGRPAALTHKVAQSVASLDTLSLTEVTKTLIEKWLLPMSSSTQDLNTTLVRELEEVEEDCKDTGNWQRLFYILNGREDIEEYVYFLYSWAKSQSHTTTAQSRTRALQLLFRTASDDVIQRVSGKSVADVRDYVQSAVFVSELGALQVYLQLEAFHGSSKQALVCSLLQNHADSPRAMKVVADICLYYQLLEPGLWGRVLDAMLRLQMTAYLQRVLQKLAFFGAHHSIPSSSAVWQAVVLALCEAGPEAGQDHTAALDMLYKCPLLFELDISAIVQAMAGAGLRSHALAASLLSTSSQTKGLVKDILSELQPSGLVQLLDEVTSSPAATLRGVTPLIFHHVDETGQYSILLGTAHFQSLVQHLVAHHRLQPLLEQTLLLGRVREAVGLVEMYNTHHGGSELGGLEALQEYLMAHNMLSQWEKLSRLP